MIEFKSISIEYIDTLHDWLQLPHVRKYWDDGDRTIESVQSHYLSQNHTLRYLIFLDDIPIGYIQNWSVYGDSEFIEYKFGDTFGVDFFIGNVDYLGKGYALKILSKFIRGYLVDADRVLVDPDPGNFKSQHVYKKYG